MRQHSGYIQQRKPAVSLHKNDRFLLMPHHLESIMTHDLWTMPQNYVSIPHASPQDQNHKIQT